MDDEPPPVVALVVVSSESSSDGNVTLERAHVLPHPLLPLLLLSESNPVAIVFVPLDPAVIFSVVPSNSQLTPEPIVPDAESTVAPVAASTLSESTANTAHVSERTTTRAIDTFGPVFQYHGSDLVDCIYETIIGDERPDSHSVIP